MKDSFGCVCISTCTESQRLPDFTEKVKSRLPFHGFCFLENRFFTCPLYRRDREKALNSLGLNMGSLKLREYTNPTSSELWPHVLLATRGRYRAPVSRTRWHFGPSKQAVTGQEENKPRQLLRCRRGGLSGGRLTNTVKAMSSPAVGVWLYQDFPDV